jgi:hypothetical protein
MATLEDDRMKIAAAKDAKVGTHQVMVRDAKGNGPVAFAP